MKPITARNTGVVAKTIVCAPRAWAACGTPKQPKNQLHNYGAKVKVQNKRLFLVFAP
jgi:hypothetical protein